MTAKEIADLFVDLEIHLIESLKRNLMRHEKQEENEGGKGNTPEKWEAWQAAKLRDIQRFRRENRAILGEYHSVIDAETTKLLQNQYAEGGSYGFFRASDDRLHSLIEEMQNNEARVENAALRYMNDVYRKTVLRTATAVTSGSMTLQKATDEATKDFLAQGINCVEYSNGRRVNIASYAEMALRTCATRAMLMGEAKQRERMGIDTVLVSQYGACSDTCLPWQGKVYIDDVFQDYHGDRRGSFGVSRNGRQYMLLSVAIKAGLFHPNCRHTITTWIEGVSKRPKPMDIAEIEHINKLEAEQRRLERLVRESQREVAGLTDPDAAQKAKKRLIVRKNALKRFVDENSDVLRRDYWRERKDQVPKDWDSTEENVEFCSDVAEMYFQKATPEVGDILLDENYSLDRHTDEVRAAEWIRRKFGGNITLLNESQVDGEKRADFLWNGRLWDLKTVTTEKAANTAIKRGLAQIKSNPGGVILDYGDREIQMDALQKVIDKRMQWLSEGIQVDVMILRNGEVAKILRYKK